MNAYLLLANGMVFAGQSVGAEGVTVGEGVFATGMVGFQETLTDPSYYGQIITQTYPLIGNYGMNKDDMESDRIWAKGYIVRLTRLPVHIADLAGSHNQHALCLHVDSHRHSARN